LKSLENRRGFTPEPEANQDRTTNEVIAERELCCVIAARLLLMDEFLQREMNKGHDHAKMRLRWVYAQVIPKGDMFENLAKELRKFSDQFVEQIRNQTARRIRERIGRDEQIFIVIDEVQFAIDLWRNAFRSHNGSQGQRRPSFSVVLRAARAVQEKLHSDRTVVVLSGTGIHYESIKAIAESNIAKDTTLEVVTSTGSFEGAALRNYICDYIFPDTPPQEAFLVRACLWLRGRCVFYPCL
jgi:hypothetical protein